MRFFKFKKLSITFSKIICLMISRNFAARFIFVRHLLEMSEKNYSIDIGGMRIKYKSKQDVFAEDQLPSKEPFSLFKFWYNEACACPSIKEPRAMCLATCTTNGIPSARFVILRDYNEEGFKFFTNYRSRKGEELIDNPNAALVFYWEFLKRSIRIEGTVKKVSEEESTKFFHLRPKEYQFEAAFSSQSQPISNRSSLEEKEKEFREQHANFDSIPKPKDWGGFILKPYSFEFWQGQSDRLHDRIRFRVPLDNEVVDEVILHQGENGWVYERLQP